MDELIAADGARAAASRTSQLKGLVKLWIVIVVVLLVSVSEIAAQPTSGATAVQPKRVLFLHTFGPNFEQGAARDIKFITIIIGSSPPERFWADEHRRILAPPLT